MARFRLLLVIVFLVVPILVGIGAWLIDRQQYEVTDNAYLKANIILVSPRVQGFVSQLFIDDNQLVKQGELLLTIDDRDFQAKVIQAESRVSEEAAHIQRLQSQKISQHAHIDAASANIAAVQARRENIQKDLQRFDALIQRGSAAKQSLDKIQSESKQSAAELASSKAMASAEHSQLGALDNEITETEAKLKIAEAELQLAKLDLEHTQITAPVAGVIGARGVQSGQLVREGMTLMHLVESNKIWVEASFKETQLEHMRLGQPATIKVDAYPDLNLTGKVDSFAPASAAEFSILPAENATGNFTKIVRRVQVKIVFDADADTSLLKPGLSVEAKVKVH
jgi:membrane fusion protein (multidrug efflux system)